MSRGKVMAVADDNSNGLLKIGEIAKSAGVTVRTLRYYEELGLLTPSGTTPGGFRLYTRGDLARLMYIKRFRDLEFPLETIKELLKPVTGDQAEGVDRERRLGLSAKLLETQLEKVEENIGALNATKGRIMAALESLEKCRKCRAQPCKPDCENRRVLI